MPNAIQLVTDALTIEATAAITAKRFIGYDGDHCGAGAKALGVAYFDAASGEQITVYGAGNIVEVTSGGAVSAGDQVASDSVGKAVSAAALAATQGAVSYDATKVTVDSSKVTIDATKVTIDSSKLTVDADVTPVTSTAANGAIITAAADAMAVAADAVTVAADAVSIASGAVAVANPSLAGGVLPVTPNGVALTAASGTGETILVLVM